MPVLVSVQSPIPLPARLLAHPNLPHPTNHPLLVLAMPIVN